MLAHNTELDFRVTGDPNHFACGFQVRGDRLLDVNVLSRLGTDEFNLIDFGTRSDCF